MRDEAVGLTWFDIAWQTLVTLTIVALAGLYGCGGVAQNGLDPSPTKFDRATGRAFDKLGVPNAVEDGSTRPTHDPIGP